MRDEINLSTFKNQYNFRIANQIRILSLLQQGPKNLNDLAKIVGISFTAINNNVTELEKYDVITLKREKKGQGKKGRIPSVASINTSIGVVCAIDLSQRNLVVTLNELDNKEIIRREIGDAFEINEEHFYKIAELIKEMLLEKAVKGRPLLYICISTPGMINKDTNDYRYVSRITCINSFNPKYFFANTFDVPVKLYNDIRIGCVAEKIYGSIPHDADYFLYVHLGRIVGTALNIDGKLYQGKRGFSGETPVFTDSDEVAKGFSRYRFQGTGDIAYQYMKIHHPELKGNEIAKKAISIEEIAKMYQEGNEEIVQIVNESAKYNAMELIRYQGTLDMEYIVIEGSILLLGKKYQDLLIQNINKYKTGEFMARIIFSKLGSEAAMLGAVHQASNLYFLRKLESITNNKSSNPNYEIATFFGDNI